MTFSAMSISRKRSSGQAVLLVILGMAVLLTVTLSIVSRTVTDVSVTEVEENSSKAFSAAEAGIERLLIGESSISNESFSNQSLIESAVATPLGEGQYSFDFTETYNAGDVATVWFVSHTDDLKGLVCTGVGSSAKPCFNGDGFEILWNGGETDDTKPAVEISVYYDTTSRSVSDSPSFENVRVKRFAFDPVESRRNPAGGNSFSPAQGDNQGNYSFSSGTISAQRQLLFARIRFLYARSNGLGLRVSVGNTPLPSQGRILSSRGVAGGTARQIEVYDYYRSPLWIFESGLLSPNDLSK